LEAIQYHTITMRANFIY